MNTVKIENKGKTLMVAHRGVSGLERENTAAAFIAAGNRSYFGIETDLRKTVDGHYVCLHDDNTGRVSDEIVRPAEVKLSTLRAVKLRGYSDSSFAHLNVPTLEEYISICKRYDKVAVLELKLGFTEEELREILAIIDSLEYREKVTFIAFDINNLITLRAIDSSLSCQFLTSKLTEDLIPTIVKHSLDLDVHFERVTKELVDECHKNGLVVNCWTVNTPEAAASLIAMGVDQITTNILE